MKKTAILSAMTVMAGTLLAADSSPKDEVLAAAKQLDEKPNYSWTETVAIHNDSPFQPGPTKGTTEKDGFTRIIWSFNDNTTEAVFKGDKRVGTTFDGGWQTPAEMENGDGFFAAFSANRLRNSKSAAGQAIELIGFVKELKKDGDVYSGDLTEKGAKAQVSFQRDADDPAVKKAAASVKFWITDGVLTKYEVKVKGTAEGFNGDDFETDRTTTVEVKNAGTTKVEIPEAAKKKLS